MRFSCTVNRVIDDKEVLANLEGAGEWCDYGVRGSPRWIEVTDVSVEGSVEVDGVTYADEAALEAEHPGLAEQIVDWALENGDWSE